MDATLRRSSVILLAALALSGCSQRPSKAQPWVWPGANRFNTFAFAQSGTKPAPALRYVEAWDAEWFDVPAMEPVPAIAHAEHRPLVIDLDHEGNLELQNLPRCHL